MTSGDNGSQAAAMAAGAAAGSVVGTGWLNGAGFSIIGEGPPMDGPGFSLHRDEAENMLTTVRKVVADLTRAQQKANALEHIKPPAQDPGSVAFHGKLTRQPDGQPGAFAYGAGHIAIEIADLNELIKRLETALGETSEADHQAATEMKQAGQNTGGYAG